MTSASGDIQEIGLFIMLLPLVAMLPILGFAIWQLVLANTSARWHGFACGLIEWG